MPRFKPGQFKKSLEDKIRGKPDPMDEEEVPIQIKNLDPQSLQHPVATYAAEQMKKIESSVHHAGSTASPPQGSIINQSVHDRMKTFVKEQYGK